MQRWSSLLALVFVGCAASAPASSPPSPTASAAAAPAATPEPDSAVWIRSEVQPHGDQLVLMIALEVDAPLAAVWDAHTTNDGWEAWAVPKARVDMRVGGTIQTHYGPGASIGDAGTNTLHIINYADRQLLTLQADPSPAWPESFRADAGRMYNVIVFESLSAERTRVISYGLGYRDTPEHRQLLEFFDQSNVELYGKLRAYLEQGTRATFDAH